MHMTLNLKSFFVALVDSELISVFNTYMWDFIYLSATLLELCVFVEEM